MNQTDQNQNKAKPPSQNAGGVQKDDITKSATPGSTTTPQDKDRVKSADSDFNSKNADSCSTSGSKGSCGTK